MFGWVGSSLVVPVEIEKMCGCGDNVQAIEFEREKRRNKRRKKYGLPAISSNNGRGGYICNSVWG